MTARSSPLARAGWGVAALLASPVLASALAQFTTNKVDLTWFGGAPLGDAFFNALSLDGRFVAFSSPAVNILLPADTNGFLDVFVKELAMGITTRASVDSAGVAGNG